MGSINNAIFILVLGLAVLKIVMFAGRMLSCDYVYDVVSFILYVVMQAPWEAGLFVKSEIFITLKSCCIKHYGLTNLSRIHTHTHTYMNTKESWNVVWLILKVKLQNFENEDSIFVCLWCTYLTVFR